jgi:hypothetical protein
MALIFLAIASRMKSARTRERPRRTHRSGVARISTHRADLAQAISYQAHDEPRAG